MTTLRQPLPGNPLIYLDIKIGFESVGRIVIELRKDVVPKTVENFRCLCTGELNSNTENGRLHYKGIKFHKVQKLFMCQSGDVINNDGTSGLSIYGPIFDDENLEILKHNEGAVSMANYGQPNTNNSQFFITSVPCPQLDGTNVVVGYVIRGMGIIREMEKYTTDEGDPFKEIIIENCGEIKENDNWGINDDDGSDDKYPPFPYDYENLPKINTVREMLDLLNVIKTAGNQFYRNQKYILSARKYRKAMRYYNYFRDQITYPTITNDDDQTMNFKIIENNYGSFVKFNQINLMNLAAVELKLGNHCDAKWACNEALKVDGRNTKALFRRGQAEIGLRNYDEALKDLGMAYQLTPDDKIILNEFNRAKCFLLDYRRQEKLRYMKLFK